jgi:tryptophan-rich sensory protein
MNWPIILGPLVGGSLSGFIAGDLRNAPKSKVVTSPPDWVFGPVWTILYLLVGISANIVYQKIGKVPPLFWIQLILNLMWSPLYIRNPSIAFGIIIAMWVTILLTIIEFQRIDTLASRLLYPYLLWVSYATYLSRPWTL